METALKLPKWQQWTLLVQKYSVEIIIICVAVIIMAVGHLIASYLDPIAGARTMYFAGLTAYIAVTFVILEKSDLPNIFGIRGNILNWLINFKFVMAGLLLIGFSLHFLVDFPAVINAILGWPALASAFILAIYAVIYIFAIVFIYTPTYDE